MSLFPAYTPTTSLTEENGSFCKILSTEKTDENQELSWLKNTSYIPENVNKKSDKEKKEDNDEKSFSKNYHKTEKNKSSHKKKKKKDKRENLSKYKKSAVNTCKSVPKIFEDDPFYEDKKQERGNFLVDTLHRPAIPRYDKYNRYFKKYKYLKKKYKEKKVRRYFIVNSSRKDEDPEEYNNDPSQKEEELTKLTEEFNKKLADNPGDVDIWLEYVRFQDTVFEFEKAYRKNPIGGERVTCERKLAILERAIQRNPASEKLLAERLELAERIHPADQMSEECTRALIQDPGNLTLWRALIRTTRNTMARCTAPGVLQVFSKAISRISQLRLHRPSPAVEQDVLSIMLECGLFLQQAGLWEQLWALLQMYLSLSLTASGQFDVPVQFQEDKLRQQEDSVVASGLPLGVLWLRVERLRAAYHFLPDNNCDSDPQRVVFSDDISGLLQPVMTAELRLRLVVLAMVLLKVPLLPTRHSVLECLGVGDIMSADNNVETLLAAFYRTPSDCRYLSGAIDLISEPQYVKDQQGQAEYLSWIGSVMQRCAELLPTAEALIVHTWTFRLHGLLCRLNSLGLSDALSSAAKKVKSHAKQLFKLPQFKDNLLLYTEYALIERDAGDLTKACKVLETLHASIALPPLTEHEVNYTHLCRRLVECLLMKDHITEKDHAVRVLVCLADQQPVSAVSVSGVAVKCSIASWEQRTSAIVEHYTPLAGQSLTVAEAMTPHLFVEWLACQALLLSLIHSVWDATALLQRHIEMIPCTPKTLGSLWVEQLYEVLVDILYRHTVYTKTSYTLLRNTLAKAISCFPSNLSLLNTLATIETGSGGGGTPLWKLVTFFPPSVPLARLILVFVVHCRVSQHNSDETVANFSGSNYLRNLLRQLTEEKTTCHCPLMWRLYLQLVAATKASVQVKAVFYKSLQACPWVKTLYLDAAKFLPEELPEIQDLLIEKELRLHVTPEELEILRD